MLRLKIFCWLTPLMLVLACSSAENSDSTVDPFSEDEAFSLDDAGTDAVPEASVEGLDDLVPEDDLKMPATDLEPPTELAGDPVPTPMMEDNVEPLSPPIEQATPPMGDAFAASGSSSGVEMVTVGSGDTLMKIAFDVYGDVFQWKKIYEMNQDKISDPNVLPKGVSLRTDRPRGSASVSQNGERFLIRQGDTLGTISNEVYGTPSKWDRLWKNNPELIKDPNRIFAGFYLYYTFTPEDQVDKDRYQNTPFQPRIPASVPVDGQP